MLPNLIDLIIIFEKLGDGDPSAVNIALIKRGLFLFLFLVDLSVNSFSINLTS